MATTLLLDDDLIKAAVELGHHKTRREAVNAAIEEYVKQQKRLRILKLEATIQFRPGWDHKSDRRGGLKRIPKD